MVYPCISFFNILITLNYKKNIQTYCVSCNKNTKNKHAKVIKTKKWEINVKVYLFSVCK